MRSRASSGDMRVPSAGDFFTCSDRSSNWSIRSAMRSTWRRTSLRVGESDAA